jgi:integrase
VTRPAEDARYLAADSLRDARDRADAHESRVTECADDHAARLAFAAAWLVACESRLAECVALGWDAVPYHGAAMARKRREVVYAREAVLRLTAIVAAGERTARAA